jgi:hypothetical protein
MLRFKTALTYCLFAIAIACSAQQRKTGLWEVSSTTRFQQQSNAPGNLDANSASSESSAAPSGLNQCYTRELIDNYGIALPPSLRDCQLSNVSKNGATFNADMTCKGTYNGRGSIQSTWTDENHVTGKVRFVSKTKSTNAMALRWTQEVSAVFENSDCGQVKPRRIPPPRPIASGPIAAPRPITSGPVK